LYSSTLPQEAMRRLFSDLVDHAGNLEPGQVYPDQLAPIIRRDGDGLELVRARWGLPSPPSVLKTARDPGVTNVRNLGSSHWRKWIGRAHRCLVPVTSFAEPLGQGRGNQWFGMPSGTTAFFAGVEVRGWRSLRKVKVGETVDDLFAFLTCPPNAEVGAIHPKAMPVILTDPDQWAAWLDGAEATAMRQPLPNGSLRLDEGPEQRRS
jgi:putative SOS response-associated peptidase YedK